MQRLRQWCSRAEDSIGSRVAFDSIAIVGAFFVFTTSCGKRERQEPWPPRWLQSSPEVHLPDGGEWSVPGWQLPEQARDLILDLLRREPVRVAPPSSEDPPVAVSGVLLIADRQIAIYPGFLRSIDHCCVWSDPSIDDLPVEANRLYSHGQLSETQLKREWDAWVQRWRDSGQAADSR